MKKENCIDERLCKVAECPLCGGLVCFNVMIEQFECIDCEDYVTDSINNLPNWNVGDLI